MACSSHCKIRVDFLPFFFVVVVVVEHTTFSFIISLLQRCILATTATRTSSISNNVNGKSAIFSIKDETPKARVVSKTGGEKTDGEGGGGASGFCF